MKRRNLSPGGRSIGIRDVAVLAGVSPITVSRALREPGKVSATMRLRVEDAVRETGYLPNRIASSLSSNRSDVVGLIVPNIDNSLYAATVQAVSDALSAISYHLLIANSAYSLAEEEALIAAFLGQRVAGIILHNTEHTPRARALIARAGVPVVETGNIAAPPLDMAASFSNFAASRAMVLHLAARGYRRIGFVSLPSHGNDRVQERRRGYEAALDELGMALVPDHAIEVPPGLAAGAEALVRLKTGCPEIDAIFFSGDVLGIGAALECQRRGWRVPGEVAIACADDLEMLAQMSPSLTTLRIPRYEIGKQAAGLLIDRIQRGGAEGKIVDLGFEIIQREST